MQQWYELVSSLNNILFDLRLGYSIRGLAVTSSALDAAAADMAV